MHGEVLDPPGLRRVDGDLLRNFEKSLRRVEDDGMDPGALCMGSTTPKAALGDVFVTMPKK